MEGIQLNVTLLRSAFVVSDVAVYPLRNETQVVVIVCGGLVYYIDTPLGVTVYVEESVNGVRVYT